MSKSAMDPTPIFPRAFELDVVVTAEFIDAQGHASNVAIVDWMNRAAIAHSAAVGLDAAAYRRLGGMFVVRRHEIDYLRPAMPGDRLACRTWIEQMEKARAVRRHEIVRVADGQAIARGMNEWAFVGTDSGRPRRIQDSVLTAFGITG